MVPSVRQVKDQNNKKTSSDIISLVQYHLGLLLILRHQVTKCHIFQESVRYGKYCGSLDDSRKGHEIDLIMLILLFKICDSK